ncbi:amidase domain-containing protein, partial [Alkalihalophilus pseudofirmus]|uniref:amidase domain-containing protein n=1 Tax=Alkalihalophilus pseudofirmus TaxID=79885 RepID=UPI0034DF7F99
YNKYSKDYPKFTGNFGTDCTNFVSQAMLVGGKKSLAIGLLARKTTNTGLLIVLVN